MRRQVAPVVVLHLAPGQRVVRAVIVVQREPDLLQVVDALRPPGGLAGRLHGGQEQGDQDGDDRDHHQQFDQGETAGALDDRDMRTSRKDARG